MLNDSELRLTLATNLIENQLVVRPKQPQPFPSFAPPRPRRRLQILKLGATCSNLGHNVSISLNEVTSQLPASGGRFRISHLDPSSRPLDRADDRPRLGPWFFNPMSLRHKVHLVRYVSPYLNPRPNRVTLVRMKITEFECRPTIPSVQPDLARTVTTSRLTS